MLTIARAASSKLTFVFFVFSPLPLSLDPVCVCIYIYQNHKKCKCHNFTIYISFTIIIILLPPFSFHSPIYLPTPLPSFFLLPPSPTTSIHPSIPLPPSHPSTHPESKLFNADCKSPLYCASACFAAASGKPICTNVETLTLSL